MQLNKIKIQKRVKKPQKPQKPCNLFQQGFYFNIFLYYVILFSNFYIKFFCSYAHIYQLNINLNIWKRV